MELCDRANKAKAYTCDCRRMEDRLRRRHAELDRDNEKLVAARERVVLATKEERELDIQFQDKYSELRARVGPNISMLMRGVPRLRATPVGPTRSQG